VDAIWSFRIDTGHDGNPINELPKLPKAKHRKVVAKKVEDGEEKVAKVARKTAATKQPLMEKHNPRSRENHGRI
jgi:hypothetical protein